MSSEFAIRPMLKSDEPFVFKAWLAGYWPHSGGPLVMTMSEWMPRWHRVVERLLADRGSSCLVAHVEGKPEALLGFAVSGLRCLHWCYVKQPFRGLGIATEMIGRFTHGYDYGPICTHWTPKLVEHGWQYDPRGLR